MSEVDNVVQTIHSTQEEVEQMSIALTVCNGRLYTAINDKRIDPRQVPDYDNVSMGYYMILQNISHILRIEDKDKVLPTDPQQRADKISWLINKVRQASIGKIGQIEAL